MSLHPGPLSRPVVRPASPSTAFPLASPLPSIISAASLGPALFDEFHSFQELADDKGVGEYRQYRAATAARVAEQDVKFETALEEVSPLPGPAGEWLAAESGQARLGAQGLLRTVDQVALGLRPLFFAYRLAVATDPPAHGVMGCEHASIAGQVFARARHLRGETLEKLALGQGYSDRAGIAVVGMDSDVGVQRVTFESHVTGSEDGAFIARRSVEMLLSKLRSRATSS